VLIAGGGEAAGDPGVVRRGCLLGGVLMGEPDLGGLTGLQGAAEAG
jgi:hypothetical protein